jgi:DNA-directed RNA polymerase subunit K/omega
MVHRSMVCNSFEFVAIASLRAHQLRRGCIPRVPGEHKATTLAQMEVAAGKISRLVREIPGAPLAAPADAAVV